MKAVRRQVWLEHSSGSKPPLSPPLFGIIPCDSDKQRFCIDLWWCSTRHVAKGPRLQPPLPEAHKRDGTQDQGFKDNLQRGMSVPVHLGCVALCAYQL